MAPEFTGGADDLAAVTAALRPDADGGPVVVSTPSGTAGVGKTTPALRAGHDALAAGWFPGGVLFINLQGCDEYRCVDTATALSVFLGALGVPDGLFPSTPQGRLSLYRSKLAALAAGPGAVLVVLDNASSTEQIRSLLPSSPVHRALVTSRHTLGALPGSRIVDLGVLPADEAAALVARTLGMRRPGDRRAVEEPAALADPVRLCGRLPLAPAVAASLLAGDPDLPIGDLGSAPRDRASRLDELDRADGNGTVTAAFHLSYARLRPDEARMFRLLSLNQGQQVSVRAAAALAGPPVNRAERLLRALRTAHVIEPGKTRGWVRFHDLLRLFAQRLREDTDDTASAIAAVDRLPAHYADAADAARRRIVDAARSGGGDPEAESWIDTERGDLRSALVLLTCCSGTCSATGRPSTSSARPCACTARSATGPSRRPPSPAWAPRNAAAVTTRRPPGTARRRRPYGRSGAHPHTSGPAGQGRRRPGRGAPAPRARHDGVPRGGTRRGRPGDGGPARRAGRATALVSAGARRCRVTDSSGAAPARCPGRSPSRPSPAGPGRAPAPERSRS